MISVAIPSDVSLDLRFDNNENTTTTTNNNKNKIGPKTTAAVKVDMASDDKDDDSMVGSAHDVHLIEQSDGRVVMDDRNCVGHIFFKSLVELNSRLLLQAIEKDPDSSLAKRAALAVVTSFHGGKGKAKILLRKWNPNTAPDERREGKLPRLGRRFVIIENWDEAKMVVFRAMKTMLNIPIHIPSILPEQADDATVDTTTHLGDEPVQDAVIDTEYGSMTQALREQNDDTNSDIDNKDKYDDNNTTNNNNNNKKHALKIDEAGSQQSSNAAAMSEPPSKRLRHSAEAEGIVGRRNHPGPLDQTPPDTLPIWTGSDQFQGKSVASPEGISQQGALLTRGMPATYNYRHMATPGTNMLNAQERHLPMRQHALQPIPQQLVSQQGLGLLNSPTQLSAVALTSTDTNMRGQSRPAAYAFPPTSAGLVPTTTNMPFQSVASGIHPPTTIASPSPPLSSPQPTRDDSNQPTINAMDVLCDDRGVTDHNVARTPGNLRFFRDMTSTIQAVSGAVQNTHERQGTIASTLFTAVRLSGGRFLQNQPNRTGVHQPYVELSQEEATTRILLTLMSRERRTTDDFQRVTTMLPPASPQPDGQSSIASTLSNAEASGVASVVSASAPAPGSVQSALQPPDSSIPLSIHSLNTQSIVNELRVLDERRAVLERMLNDSTNGKTTRRTKGG